MPNIYEQSETASISTTPNKSPLTPDLSKSVPTTLNFSRAKPGVTEKWFSDINNYENVNYESIPTPTNIYDVRGQESLTHIDVTGFQALTSPSAVSSDFILSAPEEEVKKAYYPEVEALLLKLTGASKVVFFDHTIRKPRPPGVPESPAARDAVLRAHVDQTPASTLRRVARHDPRPWRRVQLINVWRPLKYTVHDKPLAVCDFNTVDVINDLVPTTLLYPPPLPNGEVYSVKHNPNQVWWYWSEMTPDDVILLKCYDSASRELTRVTESAAEGLPEDQIRDVAGLTPHTAFVDAEGSKKGIFRHSIEVRALVYYD